MRRPRDHRRTKRPILRRRRLSIGPERLESRIVLDGQTGVAAEIAVESTNSAADTNADAATRIATFESDESLRQYLLDSAVARYRDQFGQPATWWAYPMYYSERVAAVADAGISLDSANLSYQGTNIQVAGVDEGDLVKTDGEFLYIANADKISIIDARSTDDLKIAAELDNADWISDLFVSGDRLTVISTHYGLTPQFGLAIDVWSPIASEPNTLVRVYDIADRTSPALVSETSLDGSVVTTRRIDDRVYLVLNDYLNFPQPEVLCDGEVTPPPARISLWSDYWPAPAEPTGKGCVYESEADYVSRVGGSIADLALPRFDVKDAAGDVIVEGSLLDATDLYQPLADEVWNLTSIVTFDVGQSVPQPETAVATFTTATSTVYMSADNVYLIDAQYLSDGASTAIQKFNLDSETGGVTLVATGSVPGTTINQFAVDEYAGYLRVATSEGWGEERSNNLFVLGQDGEALTTVGSITDIAPGESIFAVRFMGEEAYLVTFRFVDPLFTIDLSEPTDPVVVGELKIPGFSNYLHPVGEGLLVGLGRDGEAFASDPQVSLFDVANPSDPQRIDQVVLSGMWASWSEAFSNHHAVSYFAESGILVFPMQTYGPWVELDGQFQNRMENEFWVLQVEPGADDPLRLLGSIQHDSRPMRAIRIGDVLLTVSEDLVRANRLTDPTVLIDELHYGRIAQDDFYTLPRGVEQLTLSVLANDAIPSDATIVSVDQPASRAQVTIAADGKSLTYSRPLFSNDMFADTFTYTVESGGRTSTATVTIYLQPEPTPDENQPYNDRFRVEPGSTKNRLEVLANDFPGVEFVQAPQVTEVSTPDAGGTVAVSDDGQAVVYTPAEDFVGTETFTYTVDSGASATVVVVVGRPSPVIGVDVKVVDANGLPVNDVKTGDEIWVEVHVEDLRNSPEGVFAAYVNLQYDPERATPSGRIEYGSEFANARRGSETQTGRFDSVGASADLTATQGKQLLFRMPFTAATSGELRFDVTPVEDSPASEMLVFGVNSAIDPEAVRVTSAPLDIRNGFHNRDRRTDTDGDGEVSAIDALMVINELNRTGSRRLRGVAVRVAEAESSVSPMVDVNNDEFVSPIDALLIINELNARAAAAGESGGESTVTAASGLAMSLKSSSLSSTLATHGDLRRASPSVVVDEVSPSVAWVASDQLGGVGASDGEAERFALSGANGMDWHAAADEFFAGLERLGE
ncbi:MAG: beta-propeller domain-containing protein [Pirellulaceae bacterium]